MYILKHLSPLFSRSPPLLRLSLSLSSSLPLPLVKGDQEHRQDGRQDQRRKVRGRSQGVLGREGKRDGEESSNINDALSGASSLLPDDRRVNSSDRLFCQERLDLFSAGN